MLALDIGGTQIKAARVSVNGEIEASRKAATPASLDEFIPLVRGMLEELGPGDLGVGCKGLIHPETTVVEVLPGTMHYLEGTRLADLVPEGTKVVADNDARVAMAGERVWGAARDCNDALMFTLGTGVGGAILSGGRILRGATGVAGHLGHMTVDADGEPCICGNRGCLETVFSAKAIEAAAYSISHRGVASRIQGPITCEQVFALAAEGDAAARGIIDRATRVLAGAIAGLVLAVDPEVVILGGQIVQAGPALLDPLTAEIRSRTRLMLRREIAVVRSALSDPSGVLGAAALVLTA